MKIKKGDTVAVIAGADQYVKNADNTVKLDKKGNKTRTTGLVLEVLPRVNKVVVEGVNIIKRHQKPTQANQSGEIIEREAPISASNVMILDPKTKEPTKIAFAFEEGTKVRVTKKSNTKLEK